jgi:hypothetical protein
MHVEKVNLNPPPELFKNIFVAHAFISPFQQTNNAY